MSDWERLRSSAEMWEAATMANPGDGQDNAVFMARVEHFRDAIETQCAAHWARHYEAIGLNGLTCAEAEATASCAGLAKPMSCEPIAWWYPDGEVRVRVARAPSQMTALYESPLGGAA